MTWLRNERIIVAFLCAAIFVSAFAVVIVKNYNRMAFVESESLQHERDLLQDEWSRLQTENSTLRMPAYVQNSVRELGMVYPRQQIPIIVP